MPAKHRRRRTSHPPVALVEWHDSRTLRSRWTDRKELLDDAVRWYDELIVSAGLLLEVTKHYVVLSLGITHDDDVVQTLQIPKSEIMRFRIVRPARGMKLSKRHK